MEALCRTAATGRNHFAIASHRGWGCRIDLRAKLAAVVEQQESSGVVQRHSWTDGLRVAFLFTGQGSQYVGMGRELYSSEPIFRTALARCEALYREYTGESLLAVIYPDLAADGEAERAGDEGLTQVGSARSIDDTTYTQPALFALEYALAQLWQAWGVEPDLLLGHSVGELVAACVAGVFSLEDGMRLVAACGRLMGALPQDGAMVSLLAGEARVQAAIAPYAQDVAIAAVNGPQSVVISGRRAAVLQDSGTTGG